VNPMVGKAVSSATIKVNEFSGGLHSDNRLNEAFAGCQGKRFEMNRSSPITGGLVNCYVRALNAREPVCAARRMSSSPLSRVKRLLNSISVVGSTDRSTRHTIMQTTLAPIENTELTPAVSEPTEAQLIAEIREAWTAHVSTQQSIYRTSGELGRIRRSLAEKLFSLKTALCRPGRSGAWSSFLREQAIPRATADRLVFAHREKLEPVGNSCLTEQTKEPTEAAILRYLNGVWPKLSRVLKNRESVEIFITELRRRAEKSFAVDDQVTTGSVTESLEPTEPRI
jgi:hypothetical protein